MPVIEIIQSPRPTAQKRRMIAAVTSAVVETYDVRPEQVSVYIHELDARSWGRAGRLACDESAGADGEGTDES